MDKTEQAMWDVFMAKTILAKINNVNNHRIGPGKLSMFSRKRQNRNAYRGTHVPMSRPAAKVARLAAKAK